MSEELVNTETEKTELKKTTTEEAQSQLVGKYLTFRMGPEDYGFQILKVQEIIGMMNVTRVPKLPAWIRGIINLRGKLIPVVDLRSKFAMEAVTDTEKTCIIVVQVSMSTGRVTMGVIVDQVSEVLNIQGAQIESPPKFGTEIDTDFMLGMGKVGTKVVILLDVDKVLTASSSVEEQQILNLTQNQKDKNSLSKAS